MIEQPKAPALALADECKAANTAMNSLLIRAELVLRDLHAENERLASELEKANAYGEYATKKLDN